MLPQPEPLVLDDVIETPFVYPRSRYYRYDESYERGGVALYDSSQGLENYIWYAWTDEKSIYCKREDLEDRYLLITDTNITEIDITFDQNMNPCVAYVAGGVAKLNWYDSVSRKQITTEFHNIRNPRVSLDDKRKFNIANSDIIFAYIKDDVLHYRQQRDRYDVEYVLDAGFAGFELAKIGMGVDNRFLFYRK